MCYTQVTLSCHRNSRECIMIFSTRLILIFFSIFRELFNSEKSLIIVGVIGKSNLPNCNKMLCFNLFKCHPMFLPEQGQERLEVRSLRKSLKFYQVLITSRIELNFIIKREAIIYSCILRRHSTLTLHMTT